MSTPTIYDFDFGIRGPIEVPAQEPPPSHDHQMQYTIWHINRALECIKRGPASYTIPHIFDAFKELKVVRPIQPFVRVKDGKVEPVSIRSPDRTREQAALLLYVLLPGQEEEKCSACRSHGGSGPFARCIPKGARWTDGACLNCWFSGTGNRCDLRVRHKLAEERDSAVERNLAPSFPDGAETHAHPDDLNQWLRIVHDEREERVLRRRGIGVKAEG